MTCDGSISDSDSRIGMNEEGEEVKERQIPYEDVSVYIPTPSRSKRNNGQKIFRSLFNEVDDVADYIISIGNEIAVNAHKQKLLADKYRNSGSGISNTEGQNKKRAGTADGLRDILFHTEDVALYSHGLYAVDYNEINIQKKSRKKRKVTVSNNETLFSQCTNYQIFSWPIKHCAIKEKNFQNYIKNDTTWNEFYSDLNFLKFHNLEKDFVESRSRKHSLKHKHTHDYIGCSIQRRGNALGEKGTSDKMENEVLRDFINRSWEIAMGIASNTLESGNQRGSIHNDNSVSDRSQQIKSVKALKALGIQIDPIVLHYEERKGKFYFCQCCRKNVDFTTRANLILHLYGSKESQGCCWNLIKSYQEKNIKAALQNEAMKILDSLLHLLFEYIKNSQLSPQNSTQKFLSWTDVNNVFSQSSKRTNLSIERNQATRNKQTPSKIDPDSKLSFINDETVLTARGRLFRRYGK